MKIGITLNEVLRDFIGQLTYTYSKYIAESPVTEGDVKSLNLLNYYEFKNQQTLNTFLFSEAALEIFGHADQKEDKIFTYLNHFVMDMVDEGEHEIEIVSREVDKSIPATLFFLSKNACKATKIRFVQKEEAQWDGLDVLITACPYALAAKPEGKLSVKVKASYNENVAADFELDSLKSFIMDASLRDSILNTKIITYQETTKA